VQPLEGIRVLEFATYAAGPFSTQILADFGAEVIKIEDPNRGGDPGRWQVPTVNGKSAYFYTVNRNKKSLTVNIKQPDGQEIIRRLVRKSDVVLDQFRPGVLERLGLGYSQLSQENPRLIYCSLSGYGRTGPMKDEGGHDINFLSMAGILDITGEENGGPVIPGVSFAGLAGGSLYAVIAILLALLYREKTGQGQLSDISMVDGSISFLAYALGELAGWGRLPVRGAEGLTGGCACYNVYPTRDGKYLSLGAVESKFWQEFCTGLGVPEFIDQQWNPQAQESMKKAIADITRRKDRDEWLELFSNSHVCLTPVLSIDEVVNHSHTTARSMIHILNNANDSGVDIPLTGTPIKLSDSPGQIKPEFPELGEHTDELLQELGFLAEEIQRLRRENII